MRTVGRVACCCLLTQARESASGFRWSARAACVSQTQAHARTCPHTHTCVRARARAHAWAPVPRMCEHTQPYLSWEAEDGSNFKLGRPSQAGIRADVCVDDRRREDRASESTTADCRPSRVLQSPRGWRHGIRLARSAPHALHNFLLHTSPHLSVCSFSLDVRA